MAASNPPPAPTQDPIEPDTSETDSAIDSDSESTRSLTTSLASSVLNYQYENGRRYHAYRQGNYVLPNDEAEQDRQDLLHHVRNLALNGRLYLSPLNNPSRVLDIGTGTGIWAIDFADENPGCDVLGTDLSPIQPSWVPPNLHFQVDDAEQEWLHTQPFDLVHTRDLGGSIGDWPKLVRQAYKHLKPGGWIELQEFEVTLKSDDDTMKLAPNLVEYIAELHKASEMFGRKMNVAEELKGIVENAGFEEVKDDIYKVPSSGWPRDRTLKEVGRYNQCSLLMAVESYSLALFTRVLGWSMERTQVFLAGVRNDLKNRAVHSYCNLHIVYGRKPAAKSS